jgi:ATP-dependent RNA helicase RhlE
VGNFPSATLHPATYVNHSKRQQPEGVSLSFEKFCFHPEIMAGIEASGFVAPTPIQAQAIPPVLAGQDVLALAQTGTGKTAAFALPLLQRFRQAKSKRVRVLILAPTRELAAQIHGAIRTLGQKTRVSSMTLYGGVNIRPQIACLKKGVDIVVACPGRLLDHIAQGTIHLSNLEVLVLDEADQMFDMGFLPDIRRILQHLPRHRQTLLFGATMPDEIRSLAREILVDPATIQVGKTAPVGTVSHAIYPVPQHLKTTLLLKLLRQTQAASILVFTRTKRRAKRLGEQLSKAGFQATSLQGDLPQNRRQEAMEGFRDGSYRILAATDIAARGIDVSRVSHVINYDIPDTAETYIHRIGRTGRASRKGDAFTLVGPEDEGMVRSIERVLSKPLERRTLTDFNYKVPMPVWRGRSPVNAAARNSQPRKTAKYVFVGARRKNHRQSRSSKSSPIANLS